MRALKSNKKFEELLRISGEQNSGIRRISGDTFYIGLRSCPFNLSMSENKNPARNPPGPARAHSSIMADLYHFCVH
jgi:hypothetical protein